MTPTRKALWYLTDPPRAFGRLVGSVFRFVDHVLADGGVRDFPLEHYARIGTAILSTAAGLYASLRALGYGWPPERAWYLLGFVWLTVYLATRRSPEAVARDLELDRIGEHANVSVRWPDPTEVYADSGDRDDRGALQSFRLHYPREWEDNDRNVNKLVEHLKGKLPGRWELAAESREDNWQDWRRATDPAIPKRLDPEVHDDMPWHRVAVGRGAAGALSVWDMISTPHLLVVAGTGGGKTTVLRNIVLQVVHRWRSGAEDRLSVTVLDPKRIGYRSLRRTPGLTDVITDPQAMQDYLVAAEARVEDFYRRLEAFIDGEVEQRPAPLNEVVVVDELAQLLSTVPDFEATRRAIDTICRLARDCRLHLAFGTQQPNVTHTLSGDARENVSMSIATVPMSPQGSAMAANGNSMAFRGEADGGYASDHPGRCGVMRHAVFDQVQTYWLEDPYVLNEKLDPQVAKRMMRKAAAVFPPRAASTGGGQRKVESL